MYLYKSYCYPDIEAVANSVQSQVVLEGFGVIQSVTPVGNGLSITYLLPDLTDQSVHVTVPACDRDGFDSSYTGLTYSDAAEASGLVVVALAAAYAFKTLRRAL